MEEACDPTVSAGVISISGHESDCRGFSCNSQGEELEDEIQHELPVAASDAEHGNWRNCGPINKRLKQSIREIGGRSKFASMADRGKEGTRGGAN